MSRKKFYLDILIKGDVVEGRLEQSMFSRKPKAALLDVLDALARAARDGKTAAALLTLDDVSVGWARLGSLRRALAEFRSTGKPVYCFMETGGNAEYYLATACTRILMAPSGSLNVVGLSAQVFFFREVFDQFGILPELRSVGDYKSAGEMFTRSDMSPASREQWNELLDDHYTEFCKAISESAGTAPEEAAAKIDSGPYSAREAAREKLIHGVCYRDEAIEALKKDLGQELRPRPMSYFCPREGFFKRLFTFRRPRIAVIDVLGIIASGRSRGDRRLRQTAGAETIGKFLDHALESSRIRAVLLRIDSPGGSGIASDVLWRKISQLRERKPVVVSFGDTAASGGYYIAAAGSCIVAESLSITGSIGVLGGKFVLRDLMDRLAIRRESVNRGQRAEYASWLKPFSEAEAEKLNSHLQEFYREDFVKKVAQGRNMEEEEVDKVGRGRVWSGTRARDLGLVDFLGGPLEALREARRLAGIPAKKKIRVVEYHRRRRLIEMLMPDLSAEAELLQQLGTSILLWMPFEPRIR